MQKASYFKRLLTLLLVLCMSLTYMPSFVFAADGEPAANEGHSQTTVTENVQEEKAEEEKNAPVVNKTEKGSKNTAPASQEEAKTTEENPAGPIRAPALKADGDGKDGSGDDDYADYQTEDLDIDEETPVPVEFILEGEDSVEAWIEDVSGPMERDPDTGAMTMEYDQVIHNGDKMELKPATSIVIKGIEGKFISTGFGEDEDAAKEIIERKPVGKDCTIGTTGKGFVYIKVTEEETKPDYDTQEDEEGNISYSDVTEADDAGSYTGGGEPSILSSLSKGDTFKGTAKLLSYHLKSHGSTAKMKATTGWLTETTAKTITATCISGPTKAMALEGSKFSYTVKVLSVDKKTGKVKVRITYRPKSNKNNVSYGRENNYHAGTQTVAVTTTVTFKEAQMDISIAKTDSQPHYNFPGNYSLAGAQYTIYTDAGCTNIASDVKGNPAILTTGADGTSQTITLVDGEYYIKETRTPEKGYKLNPAATAAADGANDVQEIPYMPQVQVVKEPAKTDTNFLDYPNNYTLKGAEYTMYTDSACTKVAKDASGKDVVFVTDNNGNTTPVRVDLGTYYIKETKASKGYKIDPEVKPVVLTSEYEEKPYVVNSVEEPTYLDPSFMLYKIDTTGTKGWDRLRGAEYTIKYYDVTVPYGDESAEQDPAKVDLSGKTPVLQWTFETRKVDNSDPKKISAGFSWDEDTPVSGSEFLTEGGKRIIPLGYYTIEETKTPDGLALSEKVFHAKNFQPTNGAQAEKLIEDANKDGDLKVEVNAPEVTQRVVIKIKKQDAESKTSEAKGQASDTRKASFGSLAGAEYEVYFDNDETSSPELVGKIVTDEKGEGELTKRTLGEKHAIGRDLEVGTYYIKEVKASPGYVLDKYTYSKGKTVATPDGDIEILCEYKLNKKDVSKTFNGSYADAQHKFRTRAEATDPEVFNYTTTSNEEPHRTLISKTDITTGEELPGAKLQVINSEGEIVEEWTSTEEEHLIWALPNGTYTLREITAPYGYDVAEDIEFTVKDDVIENKVEMKNKPITIGTTAMDEATKSHQGTFTKDEIIKDTVKVTGLYEGREYRIHGVLMDKATKEAVKNAEGKEVTAEKSFTATGDEMEIELEFTVNSSEFTTDSVTVAFEYLERTKKVHDVEADVVPVELQKHEDINDEDQTIHYGGIVGTTAVDKASKSHNILAAKDVTIVDTVKYENLSTKSEYEVKGELFDKTTGKLTGIKSSAKFTPDKPNGTVDVEFKFDASELANHDLVVYETLLINSIEINKHENPDDEDQTVHVPEIHTTATDVNTGDHIANGNENVQIKDVVEYKNLIPGKEYTMEGTLMNQKTGKAVENDGAPVTASVKFTPETKDGKVELTFKFNGVNVQGETVVAFEECKVNGVPVAVHADITDKNQSVQIPKIGTKAALVGEEVHDIVSYENLKAGKYVMKGWLVETESEDVVEGSEGQVEFEVTETPGFGVVTVNLPINDYDKYGGYDLTAYEECYYVVTNEDGTTKEVLVGEHKDTNDDNQTVEIPEGEKGVKTGDDHMIFLFSATFMLSAALYLILRKRAALRK